MIRKNHFSLHKSDYKRGLLSGVYNNEWPESLDILRIPATYDHLEPLMEKLSEKWYWKDQPRYSEEALREKLAQKGTELFLLQDNEDPIGYAMVSKPPKSLTDRFFKAANTNVVEIDNLGLFPGQEGGGRGKKYFEMLFDRYFQDNEVVYWSQHETHSPTLREFYQNRMGMTLLEHEYVEDFRPQERKFG